MKLYITTMGCPKNANDSQIAAGILEQAGHRVVPDPEEAEAILVNTCGFIEDAKKESIDKIFEMAQYKESGKILLVSGCLSQRYGQALYEEIPEVDLFLGVNDYGRLPDILADYQKGVRKTYRADCQDTYVEMPFRKLEENPYTATVKIAEGCDNHCAYCIIPQIRGPYRSRKQEDILAEAKGLAEVGCKEIMLIAQDVTAYGRDLYGGEPLPNLLRQLCQIEGIQWIRLMYCYEERITDALIKVMAEEEKICRYIDIPLQHCSDKILKTMGRRSTKASMRATIEKLRKAMPDIHIRTTFITGLPGEGEPEFEELLDFVESMKFERLGVFTYSKEEGTPAAAMDGQVAEEIKQQRQDALMRRQIDISRQSNEAKIGTLQQVLVEESNDDGTFTARTQYDAPDIDNAVLVASQRALQPGDLIQVRITDGFDYDLTGEETCR